MTERVREIAMRLRADFTEPEKLASAVLHELGDKPKRLQEALAEILPGYVAGMIRASRNNTIRSVHSVKLERRREWHEQWLNETLHTAEGYKRIRETTREDWLYAAAERANHIAAETVRMHQCEAMAALFVQYQVQVAAELPADAVTALFGKAAA